MAKENAMFEVGTEALVFKSIIINVFVFAHIRSIYFRFDLLLLILHHRGNSYRRVKKIGFAAGNKAH